MFNQSTKKNEFSGREHDNGNLDDFKVFRGNSSQGISHMRVQDVVKKKRKDLCSFRALFVLHEAELDNKTARLVAHHE